MNLEGKTLKNRYQVVRKLGQGGMGAVYLALDISLSKNIAIKQMFQGSDSKAIKRFIREAQALAELKSKYFIEVIEIFQMQGHHFIAMEYVEGNDLSKIMEKKPFQKKEVLSIALQITEAIDLMHQKGICHRDIKPSNIMITTEGDVKITDFGLVKDVKSTNQSLLTQQGSIMGTLSYMAPESFTEKGTPNYVLTDIYALGATMYELIERKKMIEADSYYQIVMRVTQNDIPICESLKGRWEPLKRVITKMTHKDPQQRYSSAKNALRDLRLVSRQILSGQTKRSMEAQKSSQSWLTTSMSFFGIIVVIAFILLPWGQKKSSKNSPQEIQPPHKKNEENVIENIRKQKKALEEKLRVQNEAKKKEEEKRNKIDNQKTLLENHTNSVSFRNSARALIQYGEFDYVRKTIDSKLSPYWIEESKHYNKDTPLILLEMSAELYRRTKQWEEERKSLHTAITIIAKKLKPIQGEVFKLIAEIRKHDSKAASAVAAYSVSKIMQNKGGEFDVDSEEFTSLLQKIRDCTPPGSKLPKKVKSFHARIASLYLQRALFLVSRSDCHLELALEARNKVIANIDTARQKEVFRHHKQKALEDINQALSLYQKEQWKLKKQQIANVQKP